MAVATLDALVVTKRLEAAGFTEDQAEAVSDIVLDASRADAAGLATKVDLADAKAEILRWMFGAIALQTLVILGGLLTTVRLGARA